MAGHMGNKVRTVQNLEIIKSDLENDLIFIKGSIPGSKNSLVLIQKNIKKITRKTTLQKAQQIQETTIKTTEKKAGKTKDKNSETTTAKKKDKPTEAKKEEKAKKWNYT